MMSMKCMARRLSRVGSGNREHKAPCPLIDGMPDTMSLRDTLKEPQRKRDWLSKSEAAVSTREGDQRAALVRTLLAGVYSRGLPYITVIQIWFQP